ncbi:probable ubiquitin-conjugating enzyme E2 25 [Malania oleifera]|uniref:probable ubiquitin-conjugating enzyme E2 25 n=1 Tax=Malania oleifera TaxID=397392 RepID=UPI0025AEBDE6|nr:probable ubiquitin-conjugating enzyme E2 25 [Malania oleifera]
MESPPLATYIPQKSKKRVFSDGSSSSSCMEPEVVEIMPPIARGSKSLKQKEVYHEIIDIDMDEETADVMVIEEKADSFNKGKESLAKFLFGPSSHANLGSVDGVQSSKSISSGSYNSINLDNYTSDLYFDEDEYVDLYSDDLMFDDDYAILQAQFDNVDIPTGIEAPIPWFQNFSHSKEKPVSTSSSPNLTLQNKTDALSISPGEVPSLSWWKPAPVQVIKKSTAHSTSMLTQLDAVSQSHPLELPPNCLFSEPDQVKEKPSSINGLTHLGSKTQGDSLNLLPGVKPSKPKWFSDPSHGKRKSIAASSSGHHTSISQFDAVKYFPGLAAQQWKSHVSLSSKKQFDSSSQMQMDTLHLPPGADPMPWFHDIYSSKKKPFASVYSSAYNPFNAIHNPSEDEAFIPWAQDLAKRQKNVTGPGSSTMPSESIYICDEDGGEDDIMKKFKLFKQFDTIQDHCDHHYASNGSSLKQPSKNWAKKIQEEWRILEKDLPDTIFVRVYETRLDLLRAVIIGAEGTPYHDGLFFFDIFFPAGYPSTPPLVYYHSGGLRLNPNLYHCGKVCLSLLNTWGGDKNEKWIPGISTMLQVLVSIQGLILNAKPYFNEPGFASMSGSEAGENLSQQYNESTFILSLKTMLYTMKRPPKHFEDFVVGHFHKRAHDILVACKAYMDGAQVGCLVNGGVQDVDEGDKSCSSSFKEYLAGYVKLLVKAFTQIGVEDCDKFLSSPEKGNL